MPTKLVESKEVIARIEKAAFEQFRIKGYAAANINVIAKNAGTTRSAIYWHFKDKKELFLEIIQKSIDLVEHKFREIYAQDKSFKQRTKELMKIFSTLNENEMNVFQLMSKTIQSTAENDEFKQIYNDVIPIPMKLVGIVLDAIDIAIEEGEITTDVDPEQLAFTILTCVHSIGLKAYDRQVFSSEKALVSFEMAPEAFIDILFTGFNNL